MALGLDLEYRLRWMDFDQYGRLQPFAVLDMFQDVATVQAEQMGIGRDSMMSQGVFWVVIRSKFEIVKDPAHLQRVTVRTWPHSPSRFSFLRDYSMRDEGGGLLVKATSEWVLMDAETRKFASVKDYCAVDGDYDTARAFDAKPKKLHDFAEGNLPQFTVVPSFVDIDLNGHVNNACYANYVVDALNPGEAGAIRTFQMDYRHEAMPGVSLVMHTLVEDGIVRSKGVNPDGETAFACEMVLR